VIASVPKNAAAATVVDADEWPAKEPTAKKAGKRQLVKRG
jgi:hypothetical protein